MTVDLGRSALRVARRRPPGAIGCAAPARDAPRLGADPRRRGGRSSGPSAARRRRRAPSARDRAPPRASGSTASAVLAIPLVLAAAGRSPRSPALVRVFVPIGVMTFGGGLAMIPAIEHMVVIEQGWLDPKAFADAIALGQITPGPVAICATFIGYRVAGVAGALVATVAMFAPAIALALAAGHSVDRFRASPLIEGGLRTLAPAVIGMLARRRRSASARAPPRRPSTSRSLPSPSPFW